MKVRGIHGDADVHYSTVMAGLVPAIHDFGCSSGVKPWMAGARPIGAKLRTITSWLRTITSWPGVSGPSRAKDTGKRFQGLARGAFRVGDSPHEAGYDSGEAGYDSGEAGYDRDLAMLAPMGIRLVITERQRCPAGPTETQRSPAAA